MPFGEGLSEGHRTTSPLSRVSPYVLAIMPFGARPSLRTLSSQCSGSIWRPLSKPASALSIALAPFGPGLHLIDPRGVQLARAATVYDRPARTSFNSCGHPIKLSVLVTPAFEAGMCFT